MSVTIRPSLPRDVATVAHIYGAAVRHGTASFELEPPGEDELANRRKALLAGGYPYLVAELPDGVVAGYAYAGPYRARQAYRGTVENSVYVDEGCRRQGIARALLGALVTASAEAGFRQMVAVIGDTANQPSIRLHEMLGFDHVGTLKAVGWKHGRWLDTVLMQRPLGPGDRQPGTSSTT